MLEEVIQLHWLAGISPVELFAEAGRLREAVMAADQRMVIGCFGDDFAGFVNDDFHALPPCATPRRRSCDAARLSNLAWASVFQATTLHKGSFTLTKGTPE